MESSQARDQIRVPCIGSLIFYHSATREVLTNITFIVHFISILLHQFHPRTSGIRPWRLGTPGLEGSLEAFPVQVIPIDYFTQFTSAAISIPCNPESRKNKGNHIDFQIRSFNEKV